MIKFNITIIGSGPGGYVAAIRCAQLGMKTAIIERYPTLGGTCLNVGCIPSKALLRKDEVIEQTCVGIQFLMKKNKIRVINGHATFKDKQTISVIGADGAEETVSTERVIIATGSKPSSIPGVVCDKKRIITSTEALSLEKVPEKLIVIGGGVIGLELGSVYARLGTEVQVVEFLDRLIPGMDFSLAKEIQRILKKQGMKFFLSHAVQNVSVKGEGVKVVAKNKKGEEVEFNGDYCLVAVGRRPYTDNLGLENIGVSLDKQGRIPVNENLETAVPGIYAIGDVVAGAMLAHKAEEEGTFVAETMAGQKPHINYK